MTGKKQRSKNEERNKDWHHYLQSLPHLCRRKMPAGHAQPGRRFQSLLRDTEVDLVGYTNCDGCPSGNVEYTGEEMVKNGVQVIHLATGLLVGYPPCPYIYTFKAFLEKRYGVKVVVGTHPIPKKYLDLHTCLGTWEAAEWRPLLEPTMADETARETYD
jgi:predicted metal-binding protein